MFKHPCAAPLAQRLRQAAPWQPNHNYRAALTARVLELAAAIPIPIVRVNRDYLPFPEFERAVVKDGVLVIGNRPCGHPVMGDYMTEFRAVHDWYGHILCGAGFGLGGELRAFDCHAQHLDAWLLPFVWQNVVLENAFFEATGSYFDVTIPRWDSVKFGSTRA